MTMRNAFHTADLTDLTDTLHVYELMSYLEPTATNVLSFNADKVLNTTLFEQ